MVNLAHRMLEMSTQSVAKMKFGSDLVTAEPLKTPDFLLIIRELAMEDVSGRFSNMAAMIQIATGRSRPSRAGQRPCGSAMGVPVSPSISGGSM